MHLFRMNGSLTSARVFTFLMQISAAGVLSWKVKAGEEVVEGQVVGEIVKIEDPFAPRIPIQSRTAGLVFSIEAHKLAIPGQVVIKVAGEGPLPWRKGNLLTSR
jgi:predicted deacylase